MHAKLKTMKKLTLLVNICFLGGLLVLSMHSHALENNSPGAQNTNGAEQQATIVQATVRETVSKEDPYKMIQQVAEQTFARMKKEQANIKENPEILRDIMEQELMPYIDYRFSAFKVLGRNAQRLEKKDLQEFVRVFKEYLITSYAIAMGYYEDQTVEYEPAADFNDRTDVTVRAVIKDEVRPDIKVAFKVRKARKSNDWMAYDMIAEGISLLSSKQSEFETIIRKDGIQNVIALMRKTIDRPITLQTEQASAN